MAQIKILLDYNTEDARITSPTDPGLNFIWAGLATDKFIPPTLEVTSPIELSVDPGREETTLDRIIRLKAEGFSASDILAFGKEGMV